VLVDAQVVESCRNSIDSVLIVPFFAYLPGAQNQK